MACVKQARVVSRGLGFGGSLTAKIAVALAVCLIVRVLVAQAPGALPALREDVDARNHKFLVVNEAYLDKKNLSKVNDQKKLVREIVTGATGAPSITDPAGKQVLDRWYLQYILPNMTTEAGLKTVADQRVQLFRDNLMATKDPAVHSYLIGITFAAMKQVVQDPQFHPGARYNAMLIISNLNDQEPTWLGANQTLPEPMRAALPFIIERFKKEGDLDALKLAALFGLSRNLEWENYKPLPAAMKAEIIKEITALAEQKEAPQGRSQEGHTWLRRRAIEALGMACQIKPDAAIAATFEKLLNDDADALNVRLTVAATLGKVNLQPPVNIDPIANAKQLGYLALLACDTEVNRSKNIRKTEWEHEARLAGTYTGDEYSTGSGGMPGMPGSGGMSGPPGMRPPGSMDGGMGGLRPPRPTPGMGDLSGDMTAGVSDPSSLDPKHYRVEFFRRRIRQQLYAVQLGLTGGEDHPPPRATLTGAPPPSTQPTNTPSNEKKGMMGMFGMAKTKKDKDQVDEVYWAVRKVIEAIEYPGPADKAEFYELTKDLEKPMKSLEQVAGKRVPAAGAAVATGTVSDDAPSVAAPTGKVPGKAGPPKGMPGPAKRPPVPGKVSRTPPANLPNRQPNVFGQPRFK